MAKPTARNDNSHGRKEAKCKAGKKTVAESDRRRAPPMPSTAETTIADVVPRTKKEAALQRALAATLGGGGTGSGPSPSASTAALEEEADTYGKGSPTDRLQFGYSPAITEEAVAFHSHIAVDDWRRQRRANGRIAIAKHQKLPKPNCEPLVSVLKLKNHWSKVSQFQSGLRGDHMTTQDADELLEMLAAKQRVNPQ